MKDFLNVLIVLILTGLTLAIGIAQFYQPKQLWGMLFLPMIALFILWGAKICDDYD